MLFLALALLPVAYGQLAPVMMAKDVNGKAWADDRYIVSIKANTVDPNNRGKWLNKVLGDSFTPSSDDRLGWSDKVFNGLAAKFTPENIETLRKQGEVAWIEQDKTFQPTALSTETSPWGVSRISSGPVSLGGLDPNQVVYPYLLDNEKAGVGVDVYIVDTGIRASHLAYQGRASLLASFGPGNPDADPIGHGSHVAGTAAGFIVGVAPNATILAVKVFSDEGPGSGADLLSGLNAVAENAAKTGKPSVVNMSLGGPQSRAVDNAVASLVSLGITCVVAAGNESQDVQNVSPARVPEAITVGATDINDSFATAFSNFGSGVDVLAPGVRIPSVSSEGDDLVAILDGTSMATPHVTGMVALLLSANPKLTPAEVEDTLKKNALPGIIKNVPQGTTDLFASSDVFKTLAAQAGQLDALLKQQTK